MKELLVQQPVLEKSGWTSYNECVSRHILKNPYCEKVKREDRKVKNNQINKSRPNKES